MPVAVMLLVTLFSVTMMSALATVGHRVTRIQLALLGEYQNILLGDATTHDGQAREPPHSERQFKKRLRSVLKDLCNRHHELWYKSGVAWFAAHHDDRGKVFLLGPYENMTGLSEFRSGVDAASGFLVTNEALLLHSLQAQVGDRASTWRLRLDLDAPAALVPLRREQEQVGALLFYGDEHSPPVPRQDEQFLSSLSSIIVNSWDQWRARYSAAAHNELDQLFVCERLDDLFPAAVRVLAKYLFAGGCMLVFRPDPNSNAMHVAAATGFGSEIVGAPYLAGEGQTGRCATAGTVIRVDNVALHRDAFDHALFQRLERAHGKPVKAWMAIPIGREPRNYGVIKIVNRSEGPDWFTPDDERLAEDLAVRLQITIEKIIQFSHTETAKNAAQRNAQVAKRAQTEAEAAARERLQDLMTITHQMQGPLAGVIGALTGITADLPILDRDLLEHAQALVEDAITIGYGTFTTFALKAGRSTAFFQNEIDAAFELRELATRVQRTNPRPGIKFVYKEEPGFPTLRFDGRVFTSVLYSLIHNAIKYADENTDVFLECSYERLSDKPAVKVKSTGAPILSAERESIFERFVRGRSVEHGKLYAGVGLGLWVARQLMRALEGDLTLELSLDNARFSVFVVHFPPTAVKGR
jgi:signal transduction histidine kinase